MSIASEITRINNNIAATYTALSAKGATLPATENSANLASTVATVPSGGGANITSLSVTPSTSQQIITASGNVDGYSPITVDAVTSSIDANITAGNIKDGVSILGVTGTYTGSGGGDPANKVFEIDNGILQRPTASFSANTFAGVTSVARQGLYYAFYYKAGLTGSVSFPDLTSIGRDGLSNAFYSTGVTSISFPELTTIEDYGLQQAFRNCTLTSAPFPELTTVGDNGLNYAFYNCSRLTSVSFPELTSIAGNGLSYAFYACTGLTSVTFPKLTTVGDNGLQQVFRNCSSLTSVSFPELATVGSNGLNSVCRGTGITSISFPKLTTIASNGLSSAFSSCAALTEIHFRQDAQSTIEGLDGYSSKWGASNATIYFDLTD